jgi:hypothetical protein
MHQNAAFPEAENILWDLATSDDINYTLNTSENWLKSEDFIASEFEGIVEEVTKRNRINSDSIQINNDRKFTK